MCLPLSSSLTLSITGEAVAPRGIFTLWSLDPVEKVSDSCCVCLCVPRMAVPSELTATHCSLKSINGPLFSFLSLSITLHCLILLLGPNEVSKKKKEKETARSGRRI